MPDHVHAILVPRRADLSDLMRRWKSLSWHPCRRASGFRTRLWQEGFFDRGIRSTRQLAAQIDYIHLNPIRAGLVGGAEQWPWSSIHAHLGRPAPLEVDRVDGD
jgi:putative transposase